MKLVAKQADREKRIDYEAVVDAYDEVERAMGWYYYLEGLLAVPFAAKCVSKRNISALSVGQEVQVVGMADEEDCMHEVFVSIKHGRSALSVPLSQLACLAEDLQTSQAVADWHYWVARGYQY